MITGREAVLSFVNCDLNHSHMWGTHCEVLCIQCQVPVLNGKTYKTEKYSYVLGPHCIQVLLNPWVTSCYWPLNLSE